MTLPGTLSPTQAAELQGRANRLRLLATRLDTSRVHQLPALAGPDTWIGPVPDHCAADMRGIRNDLTSNASWLRTVAWRLDEQAKNVAPPRPTSGQY